MQRWEGGARMGAAGTLQAAWEPCLCKVGGSGGVPRPLALSLPPSCCQEGMETSTSPVPASPVRCAGLLGSVAEGGKANRSRTF